MPYSSQGARSAGGPVGTTGLSDRLLSPLRLVPSLRLLHCLQALPERGKLCHKETNPLAVLDQV